MDNNNWTKISDRQPQYPAWLFYPGTESATLVREPLPHELPVGYSHWQPANIPAPPPREMTQVEKDAAEYVRWHNMQGKSPWPCDAWHAALKWEREQCEQAFLNEFRSWALTEAFTKKVSDFFRARREGGAK